MPQPSPFQTFEWGEFHRQMGWLPLYMTATEEDGSISAMALVLTRKFPFKTGFAWCEGGPVANDLTAVDNGFTDEIIHAGGFKRLYLRIRCDRVMDTRDSLGITGNGWSRSLFSMFSNYSLSLDLTKTEDLLVSDMSPNWRRNLRRGKERMLRIERVSDPDIDEIAAALREMETAKGLPELFSQTKLESLFQHNRSNLIFVTCRNDDGELLGFRGALTVGQSACDYIAATTLEGRKSKAAFVTMWNLLMHCRQKGIKSYDLGGIDPVKNPGVFRYKTETGGVPVEFLGEWDWATTGWLRYAGNYLISKKPAFESIRKVRSAPRDQMVRLIHSAARFVGAIN